MLIVSVSWMRPSTPDRRKGMLHFRKRAIVESITLHIDDRQFRPPWLCSPHQVCPSSSGLSKTAMVSVFFPPQILPETHLIDMLSIRLCSDPDVLDPEFGSKGRATSNQIYPI